jgi:hypothetical protein
MSEDHPVTLVRLIIFYSTCLHEKKIVIQPLHCHDLTHVQYISVIHSFTLLMVMSTKYGQKLTKYYRNLTLAICKEQNQPK